MAILEQKKTNRVSIVENYLANLEEANEYCARKKDYLSAEKVCLESRALGMRFYRAWLNDPESIESLAERHFDAQKKALELVDSVWVNRGDSMDEDRQNHLRFMKDNIGYRIELAAILKKTDEPFDDRRKLARQLTDSLLIGADIKKLLDQPEEETL